MVSEKIMNTNETKKILYTENITIIIINNKNKKKLITTET